MGKIDRVIDFIGPLCERARHAHEIAREMRLLKHRSGIALAHVDDYRGPADLGVMEHAHGIAESWSNVHLHKRWFARCASERIAHADRDAFMETQNELQAGIVLEHVHK